LSAAPCRKLRWLCVSRQTHHPDAGARWVEACGGVALWLLSCWPVWWALPAAAAPVPELRAAWAVAVTRRLSLPDD